MALSQRAKNLAATGLFKQYALRLVFRSLIFAYAIWLFMVHPEKLDISKYFGLAEGFNSVDFFFLAIIADILTKFFPEARLAMGSLKQYKKYQVPTTKTFKGGKDAFLSFISKAIEDGKVAISDGPQTVKQAIKDTVPSAEDIKEGLSEKAAEATEAFETQKDNAKTALDETKTGFIQLAKQVFRDIGLLRVLKYNEEDLTADEELRNQIRLDREKEVIPVLIFWLIFNGLIALALIYFNLLSEQTILIWTLFYFLFDMICVVFWCPLQLFLMRNRCCTTCQIFNWDAIMTTTPLLLIFGDTPFAWILVIISIVVVVRWELAFVRFPERFDDRTNSSLRCAHCSDKLCYLRAPLTVNRETPSNKNLNNSK